MSQRRNKASHLMANRASRAFLVSTGISSLDQLLGNDGYPDRSTILIVGPPGIAKEALGYWFTYSALVQGDFCLYVTRVSVRDVLKDQRAFGIDTEKRVPLWMAAEGGQIVCDVNNLPSLSFNIKEVLKKNSDRRIRITTDMLSALLMLNPPDTVYRFLTQLFTDVKHYDAVLLATVEEGMHPPQTLAAMQQVFDGVMDLKLFQEGMRLHSLLQVVKMRGVAIQPGLFNFTLSRLGMEISQYAR